MKDILNTETSETQIKLFQQNCQTSISLSEDSHAKASLLLETVKDLTTPEAHSFLTSQGLLKKRNQNIFYLRMLKGCFLTTMEELSKPYCPPLMSWTMMRNQWCLTAPISRGGKDHACLSLLHTGSKRMMFGKGPSKPHRYTLASARGHELQMIPYRKLGEVPSELYEHLQNFPIGWTHGIPSTLRKKALGNAVTVNVIKAIVDSFLEGDSK